MVKDKKDQSETLHHGDFIFSPVHCATRAEAEPEAPEATTSVSIERRDFVERDDDE